MRSDQSETTLSSVVARVQRRAPIVVVCVVVAVVVGLAYSLQAQKQYTATAALLFNNTPLSQQIAGFPTVADTAQQSQQDTNAQLLQLGDLAQRTANQVGHGLTRQAVADSITITPLGDTTVVDVAATMASPTIAAEIANAYARTFVSEQENTDHAYYSSALATVDRQLARLTPRQASGAQGLALENRAQSLATLAQIRNDTVQLAQSAAVPTSPSSPRVVRNVVVAGLLGLLLGIILALGAERLDQRIRDPDELKNAVDLPLLGVVPDNAALRSGTHDSPRMSPSPAVADTFQFVRARLRYFNVDRDIRALAIVSAVPGDGKTTVAHWLAEAATAMGSQVLLIEADLRRPTLTEQLDVSPSPGLGDSLIRARTLGEVRQRVKLAPTPAQPHHERGFDVVVAGILPPNPAELLESHAMTELLDEAKSLYDLVIFDTPPLGAVSDALPLLTKVDGVVIVANIRKSRRDVLKRVRSTLTSVNAPLLGVIANQVRARPSALYGYGDGYGYRGDVAPGDETPAAVASNGQPVEPVAPGSGLERPESRP